MCASLCNFSTVHVQAGVLIVFCVGEKLGYSGSCVLNVFLLFTAAVEQDDTSGLVIEVFDDLDKVCADVVLLHGCSQSCMPNPVEGLLEVYEDMVEVLLVLEIFLTLNA